MATQEQKIAKLQAEVDTLKDLLAQAERLFMADGVIDAGERQTLDFLKSRMAQAEAKIGDLIIAAANQSGGTEKVNGSDGKTAVLNTGKVAASKLNIRLGPGTTFDTTGRQLSQNESVNILQTKDGWHRISATEWVSAKHITIDAENSGGNNQPEPQVSGSGPSSSNFKLSEFVRVNNPHYKSAGGDPLRALPRELWPNLQKLMDNLEIIRAEIGKSISINSGYRNEAHNKSIGGATNSQHKFAKAADMRVSGMTPREVAAVVERLMDSGKIAKGGIGLYGTFVHYDIRGTKVKWNG